MDRELAQKCRQWPFEEARKVLKRINNTLPEKGYVLFETGYGPSGLPHIGTFGEVVRTSYVKLAFEQLSDFPTKLICFSDDMDGLRKVPTNVPNQEMLTEHLGKQLSKIPDPFGKFESFAAHNNAKLNEFLDAFGFEYEFMSSTEHYEKGTFNDTLLLFLKHYDDIMNIMLPTLGEERQQTYSPFLPISPKTGKVLQVPMLETNAEAGTIVFEDEDGTKTEIPVTDGHCKLQWKPDWAMRWHALDVDYEMAGKDLVSSMDAGDKILKAVGHKPRVGFNYEMFLDEAGQKISKSKGNGLSIEEWLAYAPQESLAYYMYLRPTSAKKLYFDVIPKAVDEYLQMADRLPELEDAKKLENPAWYIHNGDVDAAQKTPINFGLLLNLASAGNTETPAALWAYIKRYAPDATPENAPFLDTMVGYAVKYFQDFVAAHKSYRLPTDEERAALEDLSSRLAALTEEEAAAYQTAVFDTGKAHGYEDNIKDWFLVIYQVLFGQDQGPRMGSFIDVYGKDNMIALINAALAGELAQAA